MHRGDVENAWDDHGPRLTLANEYSRNHWSIDPPLLDIRKLFFSGVWVYQAKAPHQDSPSNIHEISFHQLVLQITYPEICLRTFPAKPSRTQSAQAATESWPSRCAAGSTAPSNALDWENRAGAWLMGDSWAIPSGKSHGMGLLINRKINKAWQGKHVSLIALASHVQELKHVPHWPFTVGAEATPLCPNGHPGCLIFPQPQSEIINPSFYGHLEKPQ